MRNFTLFILIFTCALPAMAQRQCATETVILQKLKKKPALQQLRLQQEKQLRLATARMRQQRIMLKAAPSTVTIPVVVHVLLPDPSQVTDAQVMSQLNILNQDFTATNTDASQVPAAWQPLIGNTGLQFCLAQRTPDGDPTTGIVRVRSSQTFDANTEAAQAAKYAATGGSAAWDTKRYLNIWVCNLEGSFLGVATMPDGLFPEQEQGVVINYTAFGNTGTARAPYNLGRTAVHEIGHFFSLRHIWGDEPNCDEDDGIGDTPLQGTNSSGCYTFPRYDACTKDGNGIMFMNYMDYTDDRCMHLFTQEQSDRMRVAMQGQRASLMTSDGCVPPTMQSVDAQVQEVLSPLGQLCENSITPRVLLKNKGSNPLTSVQITYQVDDGPPSTLDWTGNLASLESTTVQLAAGTPGPGAHLIKAYTSLPNGTQDGDTGNDTAWAAFNYAAEAGFPFQEGFEGSVFPPPGWELKNYDNSFTWETSNAAAKSGQRSIVIRNLAYARNGPVDDLFTPVFDARAYDSVFLFFDVAAAAQSGLNSGNNIWDTLMVLTTFDCGLSFDSLYKKGGPTLVTRRQPVTTEYVPAASEWRRDSINLTPLIRKGKFRVVFRNISNYENSIYLDNINLVTKATLPYLKEKGMTIGPVPVTDQLYITFLDVPEDLNQIAIYNAAGQLVAQQQGRNINSSNRFIFDLVNEPNGVYFVKLIYRNRAKTIKITKVR